jgi:hypothetical protein
MIKDVNVSHGVEKVNSIMQRKSYLVPLCEGYWSESNSNPG